MRLQPCHPVLGVPDRAQRRPHRRCKCSPEVKKGQCFGGQPQHKNLAHIVGSQPRVRLVTIAVSGLCFEPKKVTTLKGYAGDEGPWDGKVKHPGEKPAASDTRRPRVSAKTANATTCNSSVVEAMVLRLTRPFGSIHERDGGEQSREAAVESRHKGRGMISELRPMVTSMVPADKMLRMWEAEYPHCKQWRQYAWSKITRLWSRQ